MRRQTSSLGKEAVLGWSRCTSTKDVHVMIDWELAETSLPKYSLECDGNIEYEITLKWR